MSSAGLGQRDPITGLGWRDPVTGLGWRAKPDGTGCCCAVCDCTLSNGNTYYIKGLVDGTGYDTNHTSILVGPFTAQPFSIPIALHSSHGGGPCTFNVFSDDNLGVLGPLGNPSVNGAYGPAGANWNWAFLLDYVSPAGWAFDATPTLTTGDGGLGGTDYYGTPSSGLTWYKNCPPSNDRSGSLGLITRNAGQTGINLCEWSIYNLSVSNTP